MKKKQIAILVTTLVLAIIVVVAVLFNVKTYEITFDTDGGSYVATEKVKVFKQVTRPADPTKDGYTFDNWYYNDGIFDFSTKITQDMTIEARWIEGGPVAGTYVVSFNSNGGSSIASIRSNTDGTVNQPDDPVREGYKFVSWQYNGEDFDFGTIIKSNMTLVAKWEKDDGSGESVPAEKVTLNPTSLSLRVGGSRRIGVTLAPQEATNRAMTWTTSNSKVATVDANGNVRAVGVGTAVITLKVDGLSATVTVTVQEAIKPPVNPDPPTPVEPDPPTPAEPDPPTPVDPDPPTPIEPQTVVTYEVRKFDVPNTISKEVYLYIYKITKTDGILISEERVSGYVNITKTNGQVVETQVLAEGRKIKQDIFTDVQFSRLA